MNKLNKEDTKLVLDALTYSYNLLLEAFASDLKPGSAGAVGVWKWKRPNNTPQKEAAFKEVTKVQTAGQAIAILKQLEDYHNQTLPGAMLPSYFSPKAIQDVFAPEMLTHLQGEEKEALQAWLALR